jgi:hypothetical protein
MKKRLVFFSVAVFVCLAMNCQKKQTTAEFEAIKTRFDFAENTEGGILAVRKDGKDILVYRFGDQLKEGLPQEQIRSCYLHPLYSLDGKVLTDDFPADHLHHHGICWVWPGIVTRGQNTQTWHSANLRQHFVRWSKREAKEDSALLEIENAWILGNTETIARETVTLQIFPSDNTGRAIDISLLIQAVGGPLELRGSPDPNKAYGGFSFRGAPFLKGAVMTTDRGELEKISDLEEFLWADISSQECGVAVFVSPGHPGFPTVWCIRNSYGGFLNPSWPGLESVILQSNTPIRLSYRVYIHKGNAQEGKVEQAYQIYISDRFKTD